MGRRSKVNADLSIFVCFAKIEKFSRQSPPFHPNFLSSDADVLLETVYANTMSDSDAEFEKFLREV